MKVLFSAVVLLAAVGSANAAEITCKEQKVEGYSVVLSQDTTSALMDYFDAQGASTVGEFACNPAPQKAGSDVFLTCDQSDAWFNPLVLEFSKDAAGVVSSKLYQPDLAGPTLLASLSCQ
jgi:hypothetical protein